MPSAIQWEGAWTDRGNVLSTELNNLANDADSNAGTEIDNSVNLDQYGVLELQVTFGVAPDANGYIQVHMLQALDGTNYADGSSSVDPGDHNVVAVIPVRAVTSAQRLHSDLIALQPGKTKFILKNVSGQSFPASGSTVKLYTNNDESQ